MYYIKRVAEVGMAALTPITLGGKRIQNRRQAGTNSP